MADEHTLCLSLSFSDGVKPGCEGMSEYNDNMVTGGPREYEEWLDALNGIAALAPGTRVLAGLSGGGGAAIYAGMATDASGDALYARQV